MTTDNLGGVWTFSTDLAKGLKRFGMEVILAVTGSPLSVSQKEELGGISWHFKPFRQEWMDDPWADIEAGGRWLMQLQERVCPDVVHLNACTWGNLDWRVPVIMTLHSCVLSWWEAVKKEAAPETWSLYREKVTGGIQAADMLTAPGFTMLQAAEKFYGPFRNKKVIYNGCDGSVFKKAEKQPFVFSMGRLWDEAKNINLLIQAARQINYPVYIAGGKMVDDLSGIPDNVCFTGLLSHLEISHWLSRAAVYALPVRYEPFGYTFLEAAFSGCALVGGDIPSMHEIWDEAMVFIDPDDPGKLARAINLLLEDDAERERFSVAAFCRAQERYSLENMQVLYQDLYLQMREQNQKIKIINQ